MAIRDLNTEDPLLKGKVLVTAKEYHKACQRAFGKEFTSAQSMIHLKDSTDAKEVAIDDTATSYFLMSESQIPVKED